jgi:hypothetical protein
MHSEYGALTIQAVPEVAVSLGRKPRPNFD